MAHTPSTVSTLLIPVAPSTPVVIAQRRAFSRGLSASLTAETSSIRTVRQPRESAVTSSLPRPTTRTFDFLPITPTISTSVFAM